jgi:hypothetical protein
MGVNAEAVLLKVGRQSPDEVTGDDLANLLGIFNSIREDATTVDAEFPIRGAAAAPAGAKPDAVEAPPATEPTTAASEPPAVGLPSGRTSTRRAGNGRKPSAEPAAADAPPATDPEPAADALPGGPVDLI